MKEEGQDKAARLCEHFLLFGHRICKHGVFVFVHHACQCFDIFAGESFDVPGQRREYGSDACFVAHHDEFELAQVVVCRCLECGSEDFS